MSKIYFLILEQLNLYTSVEVDTIKVEGFSNDEMSKAIHYLSVKKYVTINKTQIWLSKEGQQFLNLFTKEGNEYIATIKLPEGYQSLGDITFEQSQRLLDSFKPAKQKKIIAIQKQSIANRIRNISFVEWGIIFTIIGVCVTLWIYVLSPIVKDFFNWMGW